MLTPNSTAASKTSSAPFSAGIEWGAAVTYFTAKRTVMAFAAGVTSAATTLAPGPSLMPLASSLSPATARAASSAARRRRLVVGNTGLLRGRHRGRINQPPLAVNVHQARGAALAVDQRVCRDHSAALLWVGTDAHESPELEHKLIDVLHPRRPFDGPSNLIWTADLAAGDVHRIACGVR